MSAKSTVTIAALLGVLGTITPVLGLNEFSIKGGADITFFYPKVEVPGDTFHDYYATEYSFDDSNPTTLPLTFDIIRYGPGPAKPIVWRSSGCTVSGAPDGKAEFTITGSGQSPDWKAKLSHCGNLNGVTITCNNPPVDCEN